MEGFFGRVFVDKNYFQVKKMSILGMIWDQAQHNFGSMISHVPIFSIDRKSQKRNLNVAAVMSYTLKFRHM